MERCLAYIVGVALGDGNLSRPNGRATRLRVTCDARYPLLARTISSSLRELLPANAVSVIQPHSTNTYFNISVYSNKLNHWLPWKVGAGTKEEQQAQVPDWILNDLEYSKECLRGLFQTDGSIYFDRDYLMVNFCNNIQPLAENVYSMLLNIGFKPTITSTPSKRGGIKYTVRVARESQRLITEIGLFKA